MSRGSPETRWKCRFSRQKKWKNVHFCHFRKKWCTPNGVCTKIAKKRVWLHPAKQPENVFTRAAVTRKKPANLYSTKCRFLRHPLPGVTVHRVHSQRRAAAPGWTTPGKALLRLPRKKLKIFFKIFL